MRTVNSEETQAIINLGGGAGGSGSTTTHYASALELRIMRNYRLTQLELDERVCRAGGHFEKAVRAQNARAALFEAPIDEGPPRCSWFDRGAPLDVPND